MTDYDTIADLLDRIGTEDDWAAFLSGDGETFTLDDGATVRLVVPFEEDAPDRHYVQVALDDDWGNYRLDDPDAVRELRDALPEADDE